MEEGTREEETEDEDGKAGMPVLPGEALSVGMTVWLGPGGGMES